MSSSIPTISHAWIRTRQAIALPVYTLGLLLVVIMVMAAAIWPARTEQQRRLAAWIAGKDWP